jgi:hypothetical protein
MLLSTFALVLLQPKRLWSLSLKDLATRAERLEAWMNELLQLFKADSFMRQAWPISPLRDFLAVQEQMLISRSELQVRLG